jgi:hypothetical protein
MFEPIFFLQMWWVCQMLSFLLPGAACQEDSQSAGLVLGLQRLCPLRWGQELASLDGELDSSGGEQELASLDGELDSSGGEQELASLDG